MQISLLFLSLFKRQTNVKTKPITNCSQNSNIYGIIFSHISYILAIVRTFHRSAIKLYSILPPHKRREIQISLLFLCSKQLPLFKHNKNRSQNSNISGTIFSQLFYILIIVRTFHRCAIALHSILPPHLKEEKRRFLFFLIIGNCSKPSRKNRRFCEIKL